MESKLVFAASLLALANGDLVKFLDSSYNIGCFLGLVSTESLGSGSSKARRCPESKVTSGLNVIDVLRLRRKPSKGEGSLYRDSCIEALSGRYSEPSTLEGGGTSIGGVDAWFSYSPICLISLAAPASTDGPVSGKWVSLKLAVPLSCVRLILISPSLLSRVKEALAGDVGASSEVTVFES